jgi:glutaredoxin
MTTLKEFKKRPTAKSKKSIPIGEEEARRSFFARVKVNSDDSIKAELLDFSDNGNAQRKKFIERLINLDPSMVKNYMKAVSAQKRDNSEAFLDKFLEDYTQGYNPQQEEQARRSFFERVVDIDNTEEFQNQMQIFIMDESASPSREDFMDSITSTMNRRLAQTFMREFIGQRGLNSNAYLREFLKREDVKTDKFFEKNPDQLDLIEEVIQKEPTMADIMADVDFIDEDFGDEPVAYGDDTSDYMDEPQGRAPSWWKGGRIITESEKEIIIPKQGKYKGKRVGLTFKADQQEKRFWKIYSRKGCPWCEKAIALLKENNEDYVPIEITDEKLDKLRPVIGDYNTVPIVFLNNEFIGGYTELEQKIHEAPLKKRVKIYDSFEGPIEAPTAWGPEINIKKRPLPVAKTEGLTFDPTCYNAQVTTPWMKEKVKAIWLRAPDGETLNLDYVIKGEYIQGIDGKIVNKAGKSFYQLQCNYHSNKRHQNGYVLTSYNVKGRPVRYVVLYELANTNDDDKWRYQDEAIFQAQQKYFHDKSADTVSHFKQIRSELVSDDVRTFGKGSLEIALSQYINDPEYINRVERYVFDKHKIVMDYLNTIASISVFMKQWNKSIFKDRVSSLYYQPEILTELSLEEKLPEVFDNPNVNSTQRRQTEIQINSIIQKEVEDILSSVVRIRYPGRAPTRPMMTLPPTFSTSTSKTPDCAVDMKNAGWDARNIIYYTDTDNKIYCFDVFTLKKQFEQGNFNNVFTGNRLSDQFVAQVQHIDPYTVSVIEEEEDRPLSDIKKPITILAPGFLDKIVEDIQKMEKVMVVDEEDQILKDQLANKPHNYNDICEYCNKYIHTGTGYKTIIRRDDEYELVRLCNTNCFEGVDEWEEGKEPARPDRPEETPQVDMGEQIVQVVITKTHPEYSIDGKTKSDFAGEEYQVTSYKKRKDVLPGEIIVGEESRIDDKTKSNIMDLSDKSESESEGGASTNLDDIPDDTVSVVDKKVEEDIFKNIFDDAKKPQTVVTSINSQSSVNTDDKQQ